MAAHGGAERGSGAGWGRGRVGEALDLGGNGEGRVFSGELWRSGGGLVAEGEHVFNGEDLLGEDLAEEAGGEVGQGLQRGQAGGIGYFFLEAGDGVVGDAAGDDEAEVGEVGGEVEGKSVRGDAAGNVDADGGDFACGRVGRDLWVGEAAPDASQAGDAAGGDAMEGAEADESFFHEADKVDGAEAAAVGVGQGAEVEDGVADELAGAVVGDIATAVDFVDSDAAEGEKVTGGEDVGAVGVAAEGEDGRVLEEEKDVLGAAFSDEGGNLRLEAEALGVVNAAQIEILNHRWFDCSERAGGGVIFGRGGGAGRRRRSERDKPPAARGG